MEPGLSAHRSRPGGGRPRPWPGLRPRLRAGAAIVVTALLVWQGAGEGGALAALVRVLAQVGPWAILLVGGAEAAGRLLGSRLRGAAHLAWDGTVGLAGLIALAVALGWLPGAFSPAMAWLPVLALAPLALGSRLWRPRRGAAEPARTVPLPVEAAGWLVAAAGLLWCRVPPVFFDTLAYHYGQPSLWLAEGRLAPVDWSLMSWFPPGVSVLYGLGMAWGGDPGAAAANVLLGLLALLLAADVAARLGGARAATATALLIPSLPIFVFALGIQAADLGHGLLSFGALAAWVAARRSPARAWLGRAAVLTGGALLTKYLGVLVPLALLVGLWAVAPPAGGRRQGLLRGAGQALAIAVVAMAMLSPWLVANTLVTGSPVAPMLAGMLPVPALASGGAEAFRGDARAGLPGWQDAVRLPRQLVTGDAGVRVYPSPAWGWLPVLLAAAWIGWRPSAPGAGLMAALAGAQVAVWLATARWERFLVSASLTLAVALGLATAALWRRGRGARALILALALAIGLPGAVAAVASVQRFTGGLSVALGAETPRAFRRRTLPFAEMQEFVNGTLDGPRDRLLLVGESRHHGLAIPRAAPAPFNRHPLVALLEQDGNPEAVRKGLVQAGYTHLAVDEAQVARSAARYPSLRLLSERRDLLRRFLGHLGPPLWSRPGVGVWALEGSAGDLSGRPEAAR